MTGTRNSNSVALLKFTSTSRGSESHHYLNATRMVQSDPEPALQLQSDSAVPAQLLLATHQGVTLADVIVDRVE